ncbi:unnamed protein product [Caenorhabditis nigoni]
MKNKMRSSIAKGTYVVNGTKLRPGANILKMKWDNDIELSARGHAHTCPTGPFGTVGVWENAYSTLLVMECTDVVDTRSESNEEMICMVMVCHYKERGNVLTEEIYKEGATCSVCPPSTTCEPASGLCVRAKTT